MAIASHNPRNAAIEYPIKPNAGKPKSCGPAPVCTIRDEPIIREPMRKLKEILLLD